MLRKDLGFSDKEKESEIYAKIAGNNIQPHPKDHQGNFHWFFGYKNQTESKELGNLEKDTLGASKFQFLANMGLLPDNEILSNKLINIYGKRLFNLIHDKSRTVEDNKSFRKKAGLFLGITHDNFSDNKRIDMHLCWRMVQKIRAVQEIDTLLNTSTEDFKKNFNRIIKTIDEKIKNLKEIIPDEKKQTPQYVKDIYACEQFEIDELSSYLKNLKEKCHKLQDQDQYQRNQAIQSWQRFIFRRFNSNFKSHQGKVGLYGMVVPSAKENVSNSNSYTDAEYAIQEHIYSEWQPVTKSQLWMTDHEGVGDVLSSEVYSSNSSNLKELLLAASIAEQLSKNGQFDHIDQISTETLREARNIYQNRKKAMQEASLKAKELYPSSSWEAIKKLFFPEETDEATGLKLTSREFSRYRRAVYIQFGGRNKLNEEVKDALDILNKQLIPIASNNEKAQSSLLQSEKKNENSSELLLDFRHAPIPSPALICKSDDVVTAALDFANTFFLFFDKSMMAKRPFVSMLFFSMPFIQISFPTLASASSSTLLKDISSAVLVVEANLAKYSGLNLFLQATIHKQITIENLKQATDAIREAAEWLTCAEGVFEKALVGGLVSKMAYNLGDLVANGVFGKKDSALLLEYFTTIFPDVSGSLEGKTTPEKFKNFIAGFVSTILKLGSTALGVGVIEHSVPGVGAILEELAKVPWSQIAHPHFSDIRILQTMGVVNAAAFISFKTANILEYIKSNQLIDIDGHKIRESSHSLEVLKLFITLTHSPKMREKALEKKNASALAIAREHFQELLSQNPFLWEVYKNQDGTYCALNELGVKKIMPKRRHKYLMALLKSIPALIKMGLGLIVGIGLFLACTFSKKTPQKLSPQWYRYTLEALNLWIKVFKVLWTFAKSVLHSFAVVALRLPEVAASLFFAALFIGATVLRPLGWLSQKISGEKINPLTWLANKVKDGHLITMIGIREYFRYPLEAAVGYLLRECRNVLVRNVERELQTFSTFEQEENIGCSVKNSSELPINDNSKGTFDILKVLREKRGEIVSSLTVQAEEMEKVADNKSVSMPPVLSSLPDTSVEISVKASCSC